MIYKVFRFIDGLTTRYRFIYQQPNGFSEALAEINKSNSNNKISLQSHQAYLAADSEQPVDITTDPFMGELYQQIYLNYPDLEGQELLKSYKKIDGGVSYYRFLFLNPDRGIVEIQITIAPRFTPS